MSAFNIGIIGATGVVGETFFQLLAESTVSEKSFPIGKIKLFASPSSAGKKYQFNNQTLEVEVLCENCFVGLDLVFFSSGARACRQ